MSTIVWTLLRLNPQSQGRYVDHVRESFPDVDIYYPVFTKLSRPHKKRYPVSVIRPVYPGYVFAYLDLDMRIRDMLTCPVKARFVRFGQTISVVPAEVIAEIKKLESLKLLVKEEHRASPFQPGRKVRVSLPMADITAVIIYLMNKNRAMVDCGLGKVIVPVHKMTLVG